MSGLFCRSTGIENKLQQQKCLFEGSPFERTHSVLVVFPACGGIRTGRSIPVLTAYISVRAKGILGKGGLFETPPLLRLLYLANWFFYPSWNCLYSRFTAFRQQCCRLPSTDPTHSTLQIMPHNTRRAQILDEIESWPLVVDGKSDITQNTV